MNDCPRQNPAYRLTQFSPLYPAIQSTEFLYVFLIADKINFLIFFNILNLSLNINFQCLGAMARR